MMHSLSIVILIHIFIICFIPGINKAGDTAEMKLQERMVLNFGNPENQESWLIINDGVMGGISRSEIIFGENGAVIFQGTLSLENNGGFASARANRRSYNLGEYSGLLLQIRGDGKVYQLRLRTNDRFDGISYRYRFSTQPDNLQTVSALFKDFEPVYRGRIVDNAGPLLPDKIHQIGFLIADKQAGTFKIEVDWIKAFK